MDVFSLRFCQGSNYFVYFCFIKTCETWSWITSLMMQFWASGQRQPNRVDFSWTCSIACYWICVVILHHQILSCWKVELWDRWTTELVLNPRRGRGRRQSESQWQHEASEIPGFILLDTLPHPDHFLFFTYHRSFSLHISRVGKWQSPEAFPKQNA